MFKWIQKSLATLRAASQEARIDADFPQFKESRRMKHCAAAMDHFPTSQLEQKVYERMKDVLQESRRLYDDRLSGLSRDVAVISSQISQTASLLTLLTPDYRQMMAPVQAEINQLREKNAVLHVDKTRAYSDASGAKSSLNSWYAKSTRTPWFFGNDGQKLPQSSIFGQSLNDRDGYKSDLDRAGGRIKTLKAEIDKNKRRIDDLNNQLAPLRVKLAEQSELRAKGNTPKKLEAMMEAMRRQQTRQRQQLSQVSADRANFLNLAEQRLDVVDLKKQILGLKCGQDDYMRAFDSKENEALLRADHREQWFNTYGR